MLRNLPAVEGGYLRMPQSYITLPVSPGAKVLLMHLCSAADKSGESWWLYEDIAEMIGRSKASVVAYVRELVELGVVQAVQQKMANGFNYKRRLKVVQWADLLAYWAQLAQTKKSHENKSQRVVTERKSGVRSVTEGRAGAPVIASRRGQAAQGSPQGDATMKSAESKTERGIQPADRKNPSGSNYIQKTKTHSTSKQELWSSDDEKAWARFRPSDNDPIGVTNGQPSPALLEKLEKAIEGLRSVSGTMAPETARNTARQRLETFCEDHSLTRDSIALNAAAKVLARLTTDAAQDAAMAQLSGLWQPYWRRLPTPQQLDRMLSECPKLDGGKENRALLGKLTSRLWHAQMAMKAAKAPKTPTTPPAPLPVENQAFCLKTSQATPNAAVSPLKTAYASQPSFDPPSPPTRAPWRSSACSLPLPSPPS